MDNCWKQHLVDIFPWFRVFILCIREMLVNKKYISPRQETYVNKWLVTGIVIWVPTLYYWSSIKSCNKIWKHNRCFHGRRGTAHATDASMTRETVSFMSNLDVWRVCIYVGRALYMILSIYLISWIRKQPLYLLKIGVSLGKHHRPQTPIGGLYWVCCLPSWIPSTCRRLFHISLCCTFCQLTDTP